MEASQQNQGDYVEFFSAGTRAKGFFQCVSCEAVAVANGFLGRCSGCGESVWERAEWSPFRAAANRRTLA